VTIESNRTIGGIGALLTLTGVVSTILTIIESGNPASTNFAVLGISGIIGILTLVGFILFLVAMQGFSRDYGEHKIFRYILHGFLVALVSAIVILLIGISLSIVNVFSAVLNNTSASNSSAIQNSLAPYLSPLGLAISIVLLVYALFNYKAFNLLSDKSGVHLFGSAAKIFVLGAIVNIAVQATFLVLGFTGSIDLTTFALAAVPGGLIQYLAWAFVAKGFFSIKAPAVQATPQQTYPAVTTPKKYCSICGAQNQADSTYCVRCGKKLAP
jgi:uncharacterized membrane protein